MGFKIENGVLVKYTEEKGVKDVVIPDGVTEIGDSAFLGCSSLTSVTIPDSVTHIGENAFSRCTALKTVITANASLLMKNSLMVSFLVYEKKPSDSYFYAFSANRETSNYQYSLQRNMWNRYDDELIGTEPKFKYRLVECLLAAISRLKHPIDLREYCKQAYVALLQKNIKKLVSVAEQLDCPEVIQWMFDLNIIHSENFKAVKGVLAASSVPSIKAFSAEEKVPNAPQEPALKLPVLTEMEKYQGLETAVLQKNQDQIQFYLENYPLQENMNKLFALAIRCADVKILSMLVEGIKKYNPSYLNSNDDDTLLYFGKDEYYISLYSALHLLPNYEPDLSLPTISDEERLLVFDYLSHNALANVNSEEFLLYVIYYCDDVLYRELKKNGINKITKNVEEVSDDKNTYRKLNIYWDYDKARILGIDNDYALLACLERLLECSQAAIIDFPGSFYTDRFCSEILFDFFIEKTSMMSKYSKKNMIRGIIQCANAKNLSQILTEGWIKTENDVDYWLETAHQMNNVSPEIITLLMEKKNIFSQKKSPSFDDFSLDEKPMTVQELKKIWGTKKNEDGTLTITSYKGLSTIVVIPEMIGRSRVTAIDSETFSPIATHITDAQKSTRRSIESVEIPGSIEFIPDELFGNIGHHDNNRNDSIKTIKLRNGIKEIGNQAFAGTSISSIIIPPSVRKIGSYVFSGCKYLTNVIWPNEISEIPSGTFAYCSAFKDFIIPETVKSIGSSAFANTALEKIIIPASVREMGSDMFSGCKHLTNVIWPDKVLEIPLRTFANCSALKEFSVPDSVKTIGNSAFSESGLESCYISDSVTTINDCAFMMCKNLGTISIPEHTLLGENVFFGCDLLADKRGDIVVNGQWFGYVDNTNRFHRSYTPYELPEKASAAKLSKKYLPWIVYKKHDDVGCRLDVNTMSVGDIVTFGRFPNELFQMDSITWKVLSVENGRALLITVNCIINIGDCNSGEPLNQNGFWENSDIRNFLNNGFYDVCFSKIEKEQIILAHLNNPKNPTYRTDGGPDTDDRVFLLSIDELEQYLSSPEDRSSNGYWNLRTPGNGKGWGPMTVTSTEIAKSGNVVGDRYIRPAIWIK